MMDKWDMVLYAVLTALFTVALICLLNELPGDDKQTEEGVRWFETIDENVIRHRETGVCYYITDYAIEPLYNADGSLYVLGG